MSAGSRLRDAGILLGIVATGVGGAYLGARVADEVTEPRIERRVIEDPALARSEPDYALRSAGGFTGFGGGVGLGGLVVRTGAVEERAEGEAPITVSDAGSTSAIRYGESPKFFRIAPVEATPRPGDLVVVRSEDGAVTGVLLLPPDLNEGGGRPEEETATPESGE